ncbi:hypothetical protein P22_1866 [Propionispora sp. 2/2-37]|uniref:spore protease YyaC n=1 Tax=Propionispora sp. 2/2-37 TaxID=1677858 RepID=UPI0006BB822F|nr:spore protease YyaC [Propionispora sp. 2/2-37]CUH95786.1 hypothetical protein P22_1866 [Propionispora sp. 2/2-37]
MLNKLFHLPPSVAEYKCNIQDPGATYTLAMNIRSLLDEHNPIKRDIIILCIGTDRSTGDSLGPLTGSKLCALNSHPHVFGTLEQPVHATNLRDILNQITSTFTDPYIIAVDACLGKSESVGYVSLGRGSVKPGAAVKKDLPPVGNAYITGIVNVGGFMEHLVLQSTRLSLVMKMADTIAYGISFGLRATGYCRQM